MRISKKIVPVVTVALAIVAIAMKRAHRTPLIGYVWTCNMQHCVSVGQFCLTLGHFTGTPFICTGGASNCNNIYWTIPNCTGHNLYTIGE